MGVAGSGKTTVAQGLAAGLGWTYAEADDFHPPANVAKMAAGTPLTDDDRAPWLQAIRDWMTEQHEAGRRTIVTCSALRRPYRDVLRQARGAVVFVHLRGSAATIAERMERRTDHFMPPSLLPSQFATLEPLADDEAGVVIDVDDTAAEIVARIERDLALAAR
nr:gluconokinase [Beutenbergia cavernae]